MTVDPEPMGRLPCNPGSQVTASAVVSQLGADRSIDEVLAETSPTSGVKGTAAISGLAVIITPRRDVL